jgi:hypothetical protein
MRCCDVLNSSGSERRSFNQLNGGHPRFDPSIRRPRHCASVRLQSAGRDGDRLVGRMCSCGWVASLLLEPSGVGVWRALGPALSIDLLICFHRLQIKSPCQIGIGSVFQSSSFYVRCA